MGKEHETMELDIVRSRTAPSLLYPSLRLAALAIAMALIPLTLVITATFSSAIYKYCYGRKLTSDVRRKLVKTHAFATEILQLLIVGAGIIVGWGLFASKTNMLDICIVSSIKLPTQAWFMATLTVATYPVALLAIDMIDNRIQLGSWQHPIQTQTLVLTRASLASCSVVKRRRSMAEKRTQNFAKKAIREVAKKQALKDKTVPVSTTACQRKRPTSEPVTPEMRREEKARKVAKKQVLKDKLEPVSTIAYRRKRTTSEPVTPQMLRRFLRAVSVEVSKSGTLIREARAKARSSSAAAVDFTPTRIAGKMDEALPETPKSMLKSKYDVQSKVEVIERVLGEVVKEGNVVMPEALGRTASCAWGGSQPVWSGKA